MNRLQELPPAAARDRAPGQRRPGARDDQRAFVAPRLTN
jgi:hypothetical protein